MGFLSELVARAPEARTAPKLTPTNDQTRVLCESPIWGKTLRICHAVYKKTERMDIRYWDYNPKTRVYSPTRLGISIPMIHWQTFVSLIREAEIRRQE